MLFLASLLGLAVSANCLVVRDGQGQKNSDGSTTNPDGTISCTTDAQCQWHPESTTAKQCKYKPQVDDPWLQTQIEILANIGDGFCNTKYLCDCETNTPEQNLVFCREWLGKQDLTGIVADSACAVDDPHTSFNCLIECGNVGPDGESVCAGIDNIPGFTPSADKKPQWLFPEAPLCT